MSECKKAYSHHDCKIFIQMGDDFQVTEMKTDTAKIHFLPFKSKCSCHNCFCSQIHKGQGGRDEGKKKKRPRGKSKLDLI